MAYLDDETRRKLNIEIPDEWVLGHAEGMFRNVKVERPEASFPQNTCPSDLPEYILLKTGRGDIPLRTRKRFGAAGNAIVVHRNVLKDVPENTSVSFSPTNKLYHGAYWAIRRKRD